MSIKIGRRCTDVTHNKFHLYCGQTRIISTWKYCVDRDGNSISEEPTSICYGLYTCEEDGCNKKLTYLYNNQEDKVRFYDEEYEPNTYEEALIKYNSGTHFTEQTE